MKHEELRREVAELCGNWREARRYTPRPDAWLRSFDREFSAELARRGWLGMTWPRSVGGADRSNSARLVLTEELLRAGAPVAAHWIGDRQIGPSILRHGSPQLQQEILPGIAAGEFVFCLGMSEPEAGSDLAAARTTATKTGDGWTISGRKIWTSHAHRATHAYVLARTDRSAAKHDGLTEFVLDMDSPGISVSPIADMAGSHHFNEVVFDEVFAPDRRVIGSVGGGWRQVTEQLAYERGGPERVLSTYPVLVELLALAGTDEQLLAELGDLVARLASLRELATRVAAALDDGRAPIREAATLKYLGTTFERDVLECARRATGPVSPDSALGEAILAAPGFSIRGGASEVLLSILAKQEARR